MSACSTASQINIPSYHVLGCKVHAADAAALTDLVEEGVESRKTCIIANHNLHSLYLFQRDAKMRELFSKAKWIHADGMGVVLLGKASGATLPRSTRVTYVDWLPMLFERAAMRRWRVFYLGSKPGVAEKGAAILRQRLPALEIRTADGYFEPNGEQNERVLEAIKLFRPHLLMVGMGMPRQEYWILDNLDRLDPAVVLPCGAAIDYAAGEVPTPPRWAGRCGLEWFCRLAAEPKRLWKRYLVEPWFLLFLVATQWFRRLITNSGNAEPGEGTLASGVMGAETGSSIE